MKEKRRMVISVVLAVIFVATAAITAAACGSSDKNKVKRQLPPDFSENPVNPLEGKELQTPVIGINNIFLYNDEEYYIERKDYSVYKKQNDDSILVGNLRHYSGKFDVKINGYWLENKTNYKAFYLHENYIYIYIYIYISEGSYGGCGSYREGFSFGKYQAVRFNLDTGENEEIINEIFFENIK